MNMKKPSPTLVQVAFQGGGARLATLLAAAEAIQEKQKSGEIKISRLSGTSAGSIVACLLAGGIPISNVRSRLLGGEAKALIQCFKSPSLATVGVRLLRGKPVWSADPLKEWLSGVFKEHGFKTLGDLKKNADIDTFVISSDLSNRVAVVSQNSEYIANAIMDSCALPFLFRIWNKNSGPIRVDGGICENLPASQLINEVATHGDVIAISFQSQIPEPPITFAKFASAILDTSISSTMVQTRHRLPPSSILELQTELSTFSFNDALTKGLSEDYKIVKDQATSWLTNFIKSKTDTASSLPSIDFWSDPNQTTQLLLKDMSRLYEIFGKSRIKYRRCCFSLTINSIRKKNSPDPLQDAPDVAEFLLQFEPVDQPVYTLALTIIAEQPDKSRFLGSTANCHVVDQNGKVHPFAAVPIFDEVAPLSRRLAIFFASPLMPNSGVYTVSFREEAHNLMSDLLETGTEAIEYLVPPRADGPIERVELVLHAPKKTNISWSIPGDRAHATMTNMALDEIDSIRPAHSDTKVYAWTAENVANKIAKVVVTATIASDKS